MRHNIINERLNVPDINNIAANPQLLQRYLDAIQPLDIFKNATLHLYRPESQQLPPLILRLGPQNVIHNPSFVPYPIEYQRKKIGEVFFDSNLSLASIADAAQIVAKRLALLIKRHHAAALSNHYLGKNLAISGYSDNAFAIDSFVEKAAIAKCPVVIKGEFGTEKLAVAAAIHYNSPLKHRPFVEINCSLTTTEAFKLKLMACFKQARGGSVYFHGIDELSFSQQSLLIELLAANTQHSEPKHPQLNTTDIRLLLSTTESLAKLVEHNTFSRQLYAELDFLHVTVPSLRDRLEDMPAIIARQVTEYRSFPEQALSAEVISALMQYSWPENDLELEHTIARLMAMANNNPIDIAELTEHTPQVLSQQQALVETKVNADASALNVVDNLIDWLMKKNYAPLSELHPGLQKALRFLAENYCQSITLSQLAQNAYTSPSHLSFLLKSILKRSFKQILAELRIEKAKQIFISTSNARITDVSLDVGFGDLSHFEKIFKRYTCMTPRQFKNNHRLINRH